jgi:hypothetical protein
MKIELKFENLREETIFILIDGNPKYVREMERKLQVDLWSKGSFEVKERKVS